MHTSKNPMAPPKTLGLRTAQPWSFIMTRPFQNQPLTKRMSRQDVEPPNLVRDLKLFGVRVGTMEVLVVGFGPWESGKSIFWGGPKNDLKSWQKQSKEVIQLYQDLDIQERAFFHPFSSWYCANKSMIQLNRSKTMKDHEGLFGVDRIFEDLMHVKTSLIWCKSGIIFFWNVEMFVIESWISLRVCHTNTQETWTFSKVWKFTVCTVVQIFLNCILIFIKTQFRREGQWNTCFVICQCRFA